MPGDHFIDHLADRINLFEPWREIDARVVSFCPCNLTLAGTCSVKNRSRARCSRSRACRRIELGRSDDPGDDGPPRSNIISRRRPPCQ
jgi:hypothetical protein